MIAAWKLSPSVRAQAPLAAAAAASVGRYNRVVVRPCAQNRRFVPDFREGERARNLAFVGKEELRSPDWTEDSPS